MRICFHALVICFQLSSLMITFAHSGFAELIALQYNAWNFDSGKNWGERKHRIERVIRRLPQLPHIIAWNEIRKRKNGDDMLNDLLELLPEYKYHKYVTGHDYGDTEEGIGFFSQYPIEEFDSIKLNHDVNGEDPNRRACLYARIKTPDGQSIGAFVTHLSYVREQQKANVLDIIEFTKKKPTPQILLGDLNIYNDYQEPIDLLHRPPSMGKKVYFRDAWLEYDPPLPGSTAKSGYTFSSWEPKNRADRVMIRGPGLAVESMKIIGRSQRSVEAASDHMAILTHLAIVSNDHYKQELHIANNNVKTFKREAESMSKELENCENELVHFQKRHGGWFDISSFISFLLGIFACAGVQYYRFGRKNNRPDWLPSHRRSQ